MKKDTSMRTLHSSCAFFRSEGSILYLYEISIIIIIDKNSSLPICKVILLHIVSTAYTMAYTILLYTPNVAQDTPVVLGIRFVRHTLG